MKWQIEQLEDGTWVLLKDGEQIETAASRDDIMGQLDAHMAAADVQPTAGARFNIEFSEGDETVDGRVIDPGATNFDRKPPLPLMLNKETSMGHEGAVFVGVIDKLSKTGTKILGEGYFDSGSEDGVEAERLVSEKLMGSWSPDFGNIDAEVEVVEEDEEGFPEKMLMHLIRGTLLGGTIVPFPALNSAKISIAKGVAASAAEDAPERSRVASVTPINAPTKVWFEDPQFNEPTPMTVTEDGRIFGHAALWGTCHIAVQNACLDVPHSGSDYAYFRTGAVKTREGLTVSVGSVTLDTGHASLMLGHRAAAGHYDNTGTVVADVAAGEDEFGIWFAGVIRPKAREDDEKMRELTAAAISGDWRLISGQMELVAMLAVPVPGYPVMRASVAGGQQLALIAAGAHALLQQADPVLNRLRKLEEGYARLYAMVKPLRLSARDAIVASVGPHSES